MAKVTELKQVEPSTPKFKVVKNVTLPLFKLEIEKPLYVQITGAMHIGKAVEKGDKKMEPATLCNVINLETGEEGQIIINAVLKGIFEDDYDDGLYIGKSFSIMKLTKREGKNYNDFRIAEIEVE